MKAYTVFNVEAPKSEGGQAVDLYPPAQAQRAIDFLHCFQPKADAPQEAEQFAA